MTVLPTAQTDPSPEAKQKMKGRKDESSESSIRFPETWFPRPSQTLPHLHSIVPTHPTNTSLFSYRKMALQQDQLWSSS